MLRRTLITAGVTIAGLAGLAWWQRNPIARWALTQRDNKDLVLTNANKDANICLLTPQQIEGPFFVPAPTRRDIREDRRGLHLQLSLQIVQANGCTPITDAVVEIWHCDAAGRYSAYPENLSRSPVETLRFLGGPGGHVKPVNEKRYLRGAQATNQRGIATFETILPGWYEPRVPHIHAKVFRQGRSYLTTQLYFPSELTRAIYAQHPDYAPHGACPYTHQNDAVLGNYPQAQTLLLNPLAQAEKLSADCVLAIA